MFYLFYCRYNKSRAPFREPSISIPYRTMQYGTMLYASAYISFSLSRCW